MNRETEQHHPLNQQFWEYGQNFCVDCLKSGDFVLDCTHVDEVLCKECKEKRDNGVNI
jgi:hypothetical protein